MERRSNAESVIHSDQEILHAPTTKLEDLLPLVPRILCALGRSRPGQLEALP
jgi:hypothetical protein